LGISGALGGYVAGNVAAVSVTVLVLWPLLVDRRGSGSSVAQGAGLDRYAVFALVINAGLMVISSIDQVLVKHYFAQDVAGNYAVAFLLGRIISMSTMSLAWVIFARSATMPPSDPRRAWLLIKGLLLTAVIALIITAGYFIAPRLAVRVLGGDQYGLAGTYVGLMGIEVTLFSLTYVQAYYLISVRKMQVAWPLGLAAILEIGLLVQYHATIQQVLLVLILVMGGLLVCVSLLSWWVLRATTARSSSGREVAFEAV
jgi:O-antigen/teichoic acid export membrane protein